VPISEIGTATPGITVARTLRRNTNTTRITRAIAMASVYSTSRSEARMVVVRSEAIVSSAPAGIDARSWGRTSFTRSTVSMMLAPGSRERMTSTDGRPLARPWLRRSSTESTTSATSARRTAAPLR